MWGTTPLLTILLLVPLQGQKEAPPGNSQNTDTEVGVRFYKVAIWKAIYLSLKYATLHISQADLAMYLLKKGCNIFSLFLCHTQQYSGITPDDAQGTLCSAGNPTCINQVQDKCLPLCILSGFDRLQFMAWYSEYRLGPNIKNRPPARSISVGAPRATAMMPRTRGEKVSIGGVPTPRIIDQLR